jgi:hypothetical protein
MSQGNNLKINMKRYVYYETIIKKILDEVKKLQEEKKNHQNQKETKVLDEEFTKRFKEEICKKVEESVNMD